jgi:hypothetical protein
MPKDHGFVKSKCFASEAPGPVRKSGLARHFPTPRPSFESSLIFASY